MTPHVAVRDPLTKTGKRRKTKTDGRTTHHPGDAISQRIRKRIEEVFGWVKVPGGQAKTKFRGQRRVEASFTLGLAAYNLIRLPRRLAETAPLNAGGTRPAATPTSSHHRRRIQIVSDALKM